MRFIAKYRRYKLTAREHIKEDFATGKTRILQHGVICEFQHGGLFNDEKEYGSQHFKFKGTLQEEDEATPVDPVYGVNSRLSVFDTDWPHLVKQWEQWDGQEGHPKGTIKREVEEFLLNYTSYGRDYLLMERPKTPAPWNSYDELQVVGRRKAEHLVEKIVEIVRATGTDPAQVVAYERENPRAGSEEIVAAMEGLLAPDPTEDDELVAA